MEKVSIISVNYNQPEATIEFLHSLKVQDYKKIEVILIDNGPLIDYQAQFMDAYPGLIYIRSEENLGFAGGNNLGISRASGKYLFFLNNDTIIPNRTIGKLVESLSGIPTAGIVCPLIYYHDQKDLIQYAGYTKVNPFTGRNKATGMHKSWPLRQQITKTDYPHGAAMMIKREAIDQAGKMPENFFLYYEELDWANQIKNQGYEVFVDHRVKVFHKDSVSTGKMSVLKTYFLTRNRILFMRRYSGRIGRMLFYMFFLMVSVPKNLLSCLLKGQMDHSKAIMAGIHWNLSHDINSDQLGYIFNHLKQNKNGTVQSSRLGKAA